MTFVRGSIVWVDLGPGEGSEQRKRRPAVVVSNDGANTSAQALGRGVVTVVPLTSRRASPLAFQVGIGRHVAGLAADSIAQIEQVRSVDVGRLSSTKSQLPENLMSEIGSALRVHLNLW